MFKLREFALYSSCSACYIIFAMKQHNFSQRPIEMIPILNMKTRTKVILVSVLVLLFAVFMVLYHNTSNEKVDGGYVAYVRTNPIVGVPEFRQVIKGPGGTGLVWRQNSVIICVTPYTTEEKFDDIRAADHLKMRADAHLVWRIDANKVREFVEQYGAVTEVDPTPEAIEKN